MTSSNSFPIFFPSHDFLPRMNVHIVLYCIVLQVSVKELVSEIQDMKKNLDTVLDERNKQRDNFVIFRFLSSFEFEIL